MALDSFWSFLSRVHFLTIACEFKSTRHKKTMSQRELKGQSFFFNYQFEIMNYNVSVYLSSLPSDVTEYREYN